MSALDAAAEKQRSTIAAEHHRNCDPKGTKLLVKPEKGAAIIFYNLRPPIASEGETTLVPDFTAFYQSCSVRGKDRVKWEAKLWFLTQPSTAEERAADDIFAQKDEL